MENKVFTKCPSCGGENTVMKDAVQKEIDKGTMLEGTRIPAFYSSVPIMSPTSKLLAPKTVPVATFIFDVCSDCGCVYCIQVIEDVGQVQMRPQKSPRQPGNPFIGN